MPGKEEHLAAEIERIQKGGAEKYHERNRQQKKLFARDRLKLLLDDGKIEFEDGMFAENRDPELPSDGVVTGVGRIDGRPVAFSASDSTVKAGSAGEKSVQKNLRIQEMAMQMRIPMFYLIDSAGARITDQVKSLPRAQSGWAYLLQPDKDVWRGATNLHSLRPFASRLSLYTCLCRHDNHGGGQRQRLSRLAAHGRDGHA